MPGSFVSIPLWCDCAVNVIFVLTLFLICFNPTMVRLRRLLIPALPPPTSLFQSHYGAIAPSHCHRSSMMRHWFQSHYGAIAPEIIETPHGPVKFVSIPLWCDCALRFVPYFVSPFNRFNPTMVRLRQDSITGPSHKCQRFNPTMVRLRRRKAQFASCMTP